MKGRYGFEVYLRGKSDQPENYQELQVAPSIEGITQGFGIAILCTKIAQTHGGNRKSSAKNKLFLLSFADRKREEPNSLLPQS